MTLHRFAFGCCGQPVHGLPNAGFIAFTGTPLLKDDKTRNKFGPILHAYTMQRAVEDGAVTPLVYEERKPVVDKLLTGLDEPKNAVLYIDKHLKGHNLLQAIARVNRLHEAKRFGLLVDYRGILAELDTSIQDYQDLAAQTQAGYDIEDLAGTVSNVATEYKRLPALHDGLWAIFKPVKNKQDWEQYRQLLAPSLRDDGTGHMVDDNQKIREDFYDALTEFGMCLQLALSSRAFFEDGAFDETQIRTYKKDLKFFTDLRVQAKRDAQETVDYSAYERQIRKMVDTQVIGKDISDPPGVLALDQLGKENTDDWSKEKTRTEADLIKTRIRKTIEQDLIDDPYARKVFSELLAQCHRSSGGAF